MAERILKVASISWIDAESSESHLAFRRQTVDTDTMDERTLARFESLDAFMPEGATEDDVPTLGELIEFNPDMGDAELEVWVASHNVNAVVGAAGDNPEHAERILEAEYAAAEAADREPRKGIEQGIGAVLEAE